MMVPVRRSTLYNTQFRALIPVAVFDRWLAATGQRPRAGALNWTPMSDPGHAAGGGPHLANTSKVIDARAAAPHLVSWWRGRGLCAAALPTRRVLWPRRRGP